MPPVKLTKASNALGAINSMVRLGLGSQVFLLFNSMLENGLERDVKLWNMVLANVGQSKGSVTRIDEVIGEMKWFGPQPNAETFATAIEYHSKGDRFGRAEYYLDLAKERMLEGDPLVQKSIDVMNSSKVMSTSRQSLEEQRQGENKEAVAEQTS